MQQRWPSVKHLFDIIFSGMDVIISKDIISRWQAFLRPFTSSSKFIHQLASFSKMADNIFKCEALWWMLCHLQKMETTTLTRQLIQLHYFFVIGASHESLKKLSEKFTEMLQGQTDYFIFKVNIIKMQISSTFHVTTHFQSSTNRWSKENVFNRTA